MSDVICVDGSYDAEKLKFWSQFGIKYPEEGKIYSIREVIRHTNGETGLLLNEINNPEIPVKHSILKIIKREPTFNIKRFRNLDGTELSKEQVNEIVNVYK